MEEDTANLKKDDSTKETVTLIDSDLKDIYEKCISFIHKIEGTEEQYQNTEELNKFLLEENTKLKEQERHERERNSKTQELVEFQQQYINELLDKSDKHSNLYEEIEALKNCLKKQSQEHALEKLKLEEEKKSVAEKYEVEVNEMIVKLECQEREFEEKVGKMNMEYLSNYNDSLIKLNEKENELNETMARSETEINSLKDIIQHLRSENYGLRENMSHTINSHQKMISQTEWSFKSELEQYKTEVARLQTQLQAYRNEMFQLKEELVQHRTIQQQQNPFTRSMFTAQQFGDFSRSQKSQNLLCEITDDLSRQSIDDGAELSTNDQTIEQREDNAKITYPLLKKRKKLFSENMNQLE